MSGNGCGCEQKLYDQLDQVIETHRGQPDCLIQVLHRAQQIFGYLPKEVQKRVADGLNVSLNEVYGVVTFYSFFSLQPKGKHKICVCQGTACYVRGSNKVLERVEKELGVKTGNTTEDGNFSVEVVRCLGACGLGPVMTVDEDVHARLKPDKVSGILKKYRDSGE